MKIYLINPPAPHGVSMVREGRCMQRKGAWGAVWAPITLAILSAIFKSHNHAVKLSDCITEGIDFADLKHKLDDFQPDVVIINTATPSIENDLLTAHVAKEACKEVKTIALGIHVTVLPDESFAMQPDLDIIIRGEPEISAGAIVEAIRDNTMLNGIAGISFRSPDGILHNENRVPMQSINDLPFPDWSSVNLNHHLMPFKNKPFVLVASSRGCPYPCTFCADAAYYGKKLRIMSPKRIVDEIVWNQKTYGIHDFLFWAEGFTLHPQAANDIADEIIRRNITCRWVCNSRIDTVNLPLLKKFKQSGCWMVGYGMESGSDRILKKIKKNVSVEQIRQSVAWTKEAGLMVTGHFVVGFPAETKEDIHKTIALAIALDVDFAQFYCAVPFPGSELFDEAKQHNWICSSDWSRFEQNYSVLNMPQLSSTEIMRLRNYAYKKFYFRPRRILKALKSIRSIKDLKLFMVMLKEFLKWM